MNCARGRWLCTGFSSKIRDQITHADTHCFSDFHQCVNAHCLLTTFDFANVNGMQVGFLGQFFLGEANTLPIQADRFTN